ncbi:hypothetical protein UA08_05204 [Talaromyces atroroseus]|uniref:Uncharacterized protein n=1 Tax=Talaromyces atroroseus TaxID=1441469 RepID=A0A225AUZ9_TALAT|nr:hypothetical protein UA08_05204 [Talaromyces atroroseus]OKL59419.1 hypothetical protein UA08_05204 [Talaromyces atroroseus]
MEMLLQKPRPAHHSPLHSRNASNLDLQLLPEGCDYSPYCLNRNGNKAQEQYQHGADIEGAITSSNSSHLHIQGPHIDAKMTAAKNDSTESWLKAGIIGTSIDGTAASLSSYSSIYSSSERHLQRPGSVAKSETSGRSSLVSKSQESAQSISSSVGVTSLSNDSIFSQRLAQQQRQKSKNKADLKSKSPNQSISSFTFRRIKDKEHNPFKWLCRRSDSNIRHLNRVMPEQQEAVLGQQPYMSKQVGKEKYHEADPAKKSQRQNQTLPRGYGSDLLDKMSKLEEKIDTLIVSHIPAGKEVENHPYIEGENIKEKRQNTAQPHDDEEKDDQLQHRETLTAEIDRLIKSNNKLSSCIEALGSSGIIELIEMLSFSIEQLNSELVSLRKQQQEQNNNTTRETSHDDSNLQQQQRIKALEIQANTIQRLGILLERSEEQIKHEKRTTSRYIETISRLEKMVQVLEVEWRKVVLLIDNSEVDNNRVRGASN